MLPLFTKPLNALTFRDVEQLVTEALPEGQQVEYKSTLPSKKGETDSWLAGTDRIGDRARNEVLQEIVAFANSGGGNVVLGLLETDDHPKRAKRIDPLPRCHELADRLRLAARDCIEPQLPSLEIAGIEADHTSDGTGVVVARVPPSRLAVHRLTTTRECYVRHADRTEKMTMREIQDLVIQLSHGPQAIKETLEERRAKFLQIVPSGGLFEKVAVGVRATVLPARGGISLDQPYKHAALASLIPKVNALLGGAEADLWLPGGRALPGQALRPIYRGCRREAGINRGIAVEEINDGGLVEFSLRLVPEDGETPTVYAGWVLSTAINAVYIADQVRQLAGVPGAELLLDVEISSYQHLGDHRIVSNELILGWFKGFNADDPIGRMEPMPLRLPQMGIGSFEDVCLAAKGMLNDLLNSAGCSGINDFRIVLPQV